MISSIGAAQSEYSHGNYRTNGNILSDNQTVQDSINTNALLRCKYEILKQKKIRNSFQFRIFHRYVKSCSTFDRLIFSHMSTFTRYCNTPGTSGRRAVPWGDTIVQYPLNSNARPVPAIFTMVRVGILRVVLVVYFDHQTGAPHAVRWSKSNF